MYSNDTLMFKVQLIAWEPLMPWNVGYPNSYGMIDNDFAVRYVLIDQSDAEANGQCKQCKWYSAHDAED